MPLSEKYDFQIGKFTKKDGTEGKKLYIIGDDIDNTYNIKDVLKKNGFEFDKFAKKWFIYLSPDDSKSQWIIDNKVKPILDYVANIEDNGAKNRTGNDISDSIKKQLGQVVKTTDQLISDVKSATAPPEFDKNSLLNNLEKFKRDLLSTYDDEEFKKKMEPIIKFKKAQGYNFSLRNAILAWLQDPEATLVKAKGVWKKYFNKEVKPNSPAIALWVPKTFEKNETPEEAKDRREKTTVIFLQQIGKRSVKELTPGEQDKLRVLLNPVKASFFTLSPFFYDVRFTTQIPGTEDVVGHGANGTIEWFEQGEKNDATARLYDALLEAIRSTGVKVKFVDKVMGSDKIQGVSKSGEIEIKDKGEKSTGTIITIVHEFAHELLHQKYLQSHNEELRGYFIGTAQGRSCVEQQAELTAWIVMKGFGYDMKTAINYTTIWGMDRDNASKVFDQVASVSNLIYNKTFEELEKVRVGQLKEGKDLGYLNLSGLDVAKMVGAEKEYVQSKYFGNMSSRMRKAEQNF